MFPLSHFCCQNNSCAPFGVKDAGNLSQRGWSGKTWAIRLLYCSHCRKLFSERRGTVLAGSRLSEEKPVRNVQYRKLTPKSMFRDIVLQAEYVRNRNGQNGA